MSTSVKISVECKRLLERLQARLVIATGKKMSQQELLDTLVKLSMEKEDELIKRIAGVKIPLPSEDVDKLMSLPADWGIETREEEVDLYLYGQRDKR
ncbi:hypothetical protein J7L06_01035 [Candidatus Bathyarchaeota archaeon]|nr:hypothetical protein [Candidatus Bathyarchaeota archaeon]